MNLVRCSYEVKFKLKLNNSNLKSVYKNKKKLFFYCITNFSVIRILCNIKVITF